MWGIVSRSQSLYLLGGKLGRGKGCSCAHYHEGQAQICQRDVLRERDELWLYISKLNYHIALASHLEHRHEPRALQVRWSKGPLRTTFVSIRWITSNKTH